MTKEQHEELMEEAVRDYALQMKKDRDADTVRAYEQKLRGTVKNYKFTVEDYTTGGRKNRALAVGECILQACDKLEKEAVNHKFMPGSLAWNIIEDRVKDEDGTKGYKYTVTCVIATDEAAFTEEQIQAEVQDLQKRLEMETAEMFREDDVVIEDSQVQ